MDGIYMSHHFCLLHPSYLTKYIDPEFITGRLDYFSDETIVDQIIGPHHSYSGKILPPPDHLTYASKNRK